MTDSISLELPSEFRHDPDVLRAYMRRHGLSSKLVAAMVGIEQRSMRRWLSVEGDIGGRTMPYASWIAMRAWTEYATADQRRQLLKETRTGKGRTKAPLRKRRAVD